MKILKINEVAKLLGVCDETLRRWDNKCLLKSHRTPTGRRFYTDEDIEKYLKETVK